MSQHTIGSTFALLASLSLVSGVAGGPCWCEIPDAGSLPPGAQPPTGSGPLGCIMGGLGTGPSPLAGGDGGDGGDFEDMYLICICDVEGFSATISFADAPFEFNTQLWLFRPTGSASAVGLLGNDDVSRVDQSSILIPVPSDGKPSLTTPGNYYLAITGFDNDPVSAGGAIFDQVTTDEISGPDGPGGALPISGWSPGLGDTGEYTIVLTGVTYPGTCVCAGDTNFDGTVNIGDIVNVIVCWGTDGVDCPGRGVRSDLNDDGVVSVLDLLIVLLGYGECSVPDCPD